MNLLCGALALCADLRDGAVAQKARLGHELLRNAYLTWPCAQSCSNFLA